MKINRFEDLDCWQEARDLVRKVYETTKDGDFKRDFRLAGQVQGAAASVMANIAEGFIRRSDKEFVQFLFVKKHAQFNKDRVLDCHDAIKD